MAYTDITTTLSNYGRYTSSSVGTIDYDDDWLGGGNTYGFSLSAYNGTTSYLASGNLGQGNSMANCKIELTPPNGTNLNIKINYICSGENKYDYAMFGKSASVFTTATTYTASTVYAHTYTGQSLVEKEVNYHITAATNFMIAYRKDSSVNGGLDRLFFRISVEPESTNPPSSLVYYYYGFAVKYYGYTTSTLSPYSLTPSNASLYFETTHSSDYASGTTGNYVYYWCSGATDDDPIYLHPGYFNAGRVFFRANGHRRVETEIKYKQINFGTLSDVTSQSVTALTATTAYTQEIYLRQYLYGLAAISNYTMSPHSHVILDAFNPVTNQHLTGKTGGFGEVILFSSAFTADADAEFSGNISISAKRKSATGTTVYHDYGAIQKSSFDTYTDDENANVNKWIIFYVNNSQNSGICATGKILKDIAPDATFSLTGEDLQIELNDKYILSVGFEVEDDTPDTYTYGYREIFSLPFITYIPTNNLYFTRENENIDDDWEGVDTGGTVINTGVTVNAYPLSISWQKTSTQPYLLSTFTLKAIPSAGTGTILYNLAVQQSLNGSSGTFLVPSPNDQANNVVQLELTLTAGNSVNRSVYFNTVSNGTLYFEFSPGVTVATIPVNSNLTINGGSMTIYNL